MIGAIIGDVIGSRFEKNNIKTKDFELFTAASHFTDDTVLTIAVADAILKENSYEKSVRNFGRSYPMAGYGGTFKKWLLGLKKGPYNSWGNGSAMRVSPIGFAFDTEEKVLLEAEKSAEITHNHPEGIKGAQAIAMAIYLAKNGRSKGEIKEYISSNFGYDLFRKIDDIRKDYQFDVSCQGSVPEALLSFFESNNFEDAIRTAISIGGDSDTLACMAGAVSQAFYTEIPAKLIVETKNRLPPKFVRILQEFEGKYDTI